jgi:hypothetical protein
MEAAENEPSPANAQLMEADKGFVEVVYLNASATRAGGVSTPADPRTDI